METNADNETGVTGPQMTIHQLWLGPELEKEDKKLIESTFKTCGKVGIGYHLWGLRDIIAAFPRDEVFLLWERLWGTIPFPAVMAASVDYFKWKVLSLTAEDEISIYLDVDVEMMRRKGKKEVYTIPPTESFISFGAMMDGISPSVSYIQVFGNRAAEIAVNEADKLLSGLEIDSPTFLSSFFSDCGNGQRNGKYSLGSTWVREKLLPRLEEADLSAEIASPDIFSQYGQAPHPLLYHHEKHFSTGGESSTEGVTNRKAENLEKVKRVEEEVNGRKKEVVILMSTAGEYGEGSMNRTLGLIRAKDIRDIQRKTTFSHASEYEKADYYFILGGGKESISPEEAELPEFFFSLSGDGKEWEGRREWEAMKWMGEAPNYSFLFICQDDGYIHLKRLLAYTEGKEAFSMKVYGKDEHTGILIPAKVVRKLILADFDPPKEGEGIGEWLSHALPLIDAELVEEDKFSGEKWVYPSPTNGKITTHDVNPYDLCLLSGMNE